nr:MAG: hypothetical protein [Porcellio scaber clopovirus]
MDASKSRMTASRDFFSSYHANGTEISLVTFIPLDDLKIYEFEKTSNIFKESFGESLRVVVHKKAEDLGIFFEVFDNNPHLQNIINSTYAYQAFYHIKITLLSTKNLKNKYLFYEGLKKKPLFKKGRYNGLLAVEQNNAAAIRNPDLFHTFLEDIEIKDFLKAAQEIIIKDDETVSKENELSASISSPPSKKIKLYSLGDNEASSIFSSSHLQNEKKDHHCICFIKIKITLNFREVCEKFMNLQIKNMIRITKPIIIYDGKFNSQNFSYKHTIFVEKNRARFLENIIIFVQREKRMTRFFYLCGKKQRKPNTLPFEKFECREHDISSFEIMDRARWFLLIDDVDEVKLFKTNEERKEISIEGYFEKTINVQSLNEDAFDKNMLKFVCFKKIPGEIDAFLEGVVNTKKIKNNEDIHIIIIIDKRTFRYGDDGDMFHILSEFQERGFAPNNNFEIHNVNVETVLEMFRFLITGYIPQNFLKKPINLGELLILANYFQIEQLMNYLNIYVRDILNTNNAVYFFCLSQKFNILNLREKTLNYVFKQYKKIEGLNILNNLFPEYDYLVHTYIPQKIQKISNNSDKEGIKKKSRWETLIQEDSLYYQKKYNSDVRVSNWQISVGRRNGKIKFYTPRDYFRNRLTGNPAKK